MTVVSVCLLYVKKISVVMRGGCLQEVCVTIDWVLE